MKELREKLRAKLADARAILETAKQAKRTLTAEEKTRFDALKAEADSIRQQITLQEEADALDGEINAMAPATQTGQRSDDPANQGGDPTETRHTVEVRTPKYEPGDALGALVAARHRFGQDKAAAVKWAERQYGSGSRQVRTMQAAAFTSGGATISENFLASELIEYLRAAAKVRAAGARELPLVGGSATIPKITGGATAYWGGEGDNINASELTTGQVVLVEKKLTCLVPVSNDLLKNSNLQVDRLIRDDMVRAAANAEDIAFLKGDGTQNSPKGIYYWVLAAQRSNSVGTTLANVRTDIRTMKNGLGNANVPEVKRAFFAHSRTKNYMGWDLVDGNGNFAFPQLQGGDGVAVAGATFWQDNNISIALGGATNSEIYYAEMSECFIGDSGDLEIELFANATYVDSGGNVRSGVSRDESVIRLIRKADFGMRHTASAYVLEAVQYGQ